MRKPTTLRLLLIGVLVLAQVTTVVFMLMSLRAQTDRQFADNASTTLDRLSHSIVDQTDLYLAPPENILRVGRALIEDGLLDAGNADDLARFFATEVITSDWITALYLGRVDGSFFQLSRTERGFSSRQIRSAPNGPQMIDKHWSTSSPDVRISRPDRDGYDPRIRPWYQQALQADTVVWTRAYQFFWSMEPGISAAVALRSSTGVPLGVLAVDVDMTKLSQLISRQVSATGGTAVIVDQQDHVVAFSGDLPTSEQSADALPRLSVLGARPLTTLAEGLAVQGWPANGDEPELQKIDFQSRRHLGMLRPMSVSGGKMNWNLLVQVPASAYDGGLPGTILETLGWIIVAILLPGLLAGIAILRVTEPVVQLHTDATTDWLTGALNRAEFVRRLRALRAQRRSGEQDNLLALVALDLDGFKQINDRFGHDAGDAVLVEVVQRLQRRLRQSDLVARLGGDEFMLALQIESGVDVARFVESIRQVVADAPVVTDQGTQVIGVTAGLAVCDQRESWKQAMQRADQALVSGKACSKGRSYLAPHFGIKASEPKELERAA